MNHKIHCLLLEKRYNFRFIFQEAEGTLHRRVSPGDGAAQEAVHAGHLRHAGGGQQAEGRRRGEAAQTGRRSKVGGLDVVDRHIVGRGGIRVFDETTEKPDFLFQIPDFPPNLRIYTVFGLYA